MALQGGYRFPVAMGDVFPDGCYAMSVEQAQDYDEKSGRRTPSKDKQTGELVWTVTVIDRDPLAREKQVKVKVTAPYQPVLPGEIAPGDGSARGGLHRVDDHPVRQRGPGRWPGSDGVLDPGDRAVRPGQGPRRFGLRCRRAGSFRRAGAQRRSWRDAGREGRLTPRLHPPRGRTRQVGRRFVFGGPWELASPQLPPGSLCSPRHSH